MFEYYFEKDDPIIKFRAVEEGDLEFLWNLRRDEEVNNFLFTTYPISMSTQKQWLSSMLSSQTKKVLIVEAEIGAAIKKIGCARITDIDHLNRRVEIGADISASHRGKGLAKYLYSALCQYCFDYLNMHKIYLYVLAENKKAIHVYEKAGFKEETVLKAHFFKHGKYQDIVMMSKFSSEKM